MYFMYEDSIKWSKIITIDIDEKAMTFLFSHEA